MGLAFAAFCVNCLSCIPTYGCGFFCSSACDSFLSFLSCGFYALSYLEFVCTLLIDFQVSSYSNLHIQLYLCYYYTLYFYLLASLDPLSCFLDSVAGSVAGSAADSAPALDLTAGSETPLIIVPQKVLPLAPHIGPPPFLLLKLKIRSSQ